MTTSPISTLASQTNKGEDTSTKGYVMQKNGMGGRGIVYNTYSIDI